MLNELVRAVRLRTRGWIRRWNFERDSLVFDKILRDVKFRDSLHVCSEPDSSQYMWALTVIGPHGSHTAGIFSTFAEAQDAVLQDGEWLWEYCYSLAVVEHIRYGIQVPQLESYWYAWRIDQYAPIDQPPQYRELVGWMDLKDN